MRNVYVPLSAFTIFSDFALSGRSSVFALLGGSFPLPGLSLPVFVETFFGRDPCAGPPGSAALAAFFALADFFRVSIFLLRSQAQTRLIYPKALGP